MSDTERRIQELELTKASLDELATKVDGAETKLKVSEKHVRSREEKVSLKSNQFPGKEATATGNQEGIVLLEKEGEFSG